MTTGSIACERARNFALDRRTVDDFRKFRDVFVQNGYGYDRAPLFGDKRGEYVPPHAPKTSRMSALFSIPSRQILKKGGLIVRIPYNQNLMY